MSTEIEARCPKCGCDVRMDHEKKFSCTRDEGHYSVAMGGPGSGWSAASGHVKGSQGGKDADHSKAAEAHKAAGMAHSNASNLTPSDKSSADQLYGTADSLSKAAGVATRATGAKPYEHEAAQSYAKMAKEAAAKGDTTSAQMYHREAAKYHFGAARRHESMVKK